MNTIESNTLWPDAVERAARSVVGLATRRRHGAATAWRSGVLVGSASLLWRALRIDVVLPSGERIEGELRGLDPSTDLAVVTCAGDAIASIAAPDGVLPRVGDAVMAVAREPSGLTQASFGHVGLVGGPWHTWRGGRVDALVRLDGGLYPGFEGALLANRAGQALGVASSALSRHHGIVLPVATVDRVVDELLAHGRVKQGYLGLAAQSAVVQVAGAATPALLVSSLAETGPAVLAGLLVGDAILSVDGVAVQRPELLRTFLRPGFAVTLAILRGGQTHTLNVDVAERPIRPCG